MSKRLGIVDADGIHWRFHSESYNDKMVGKFPEKSDDADLNYFVLSVSHKGDFWFFNLCLRRCPKGMLIDLVINVQMADSQSGKIYVDQRWQVENLADYKSGPVKLYPSKTSVMDKSVTNWRKSVAISSVTRTFDGGFGKTKPSSHIIPMETRHLVSMSSGNLVANATNGHETTSIPQTDVIVIEDSSADEGVSNGVDNYSAHRVVNSPYSLAKVVTKIEGKTAESSTQTDFSAEDFAATASTSGATQSMTSNVNRIGQTVGESNQLQAGTVSQLSYETLRMISTMVETQVGLANAQTASQISVLLAENLRLTSSLYQTQLQLVKREAEAKMTQLQLNCDWLEAQCKALAELLEAERKCHQTENVNLCERNAVLEVKLIELQNRLQQQKQQPNDQNSLDNRDPQKLKNRFVKRYIEEGNVPSSTVSIPPESSQPPSKRQKIDQSATDVMGPEP